MKRAGLIILLALAVLAVPLFARAQQLPKIPARIGVLGNNPSPMWDALMESLRTLGYVEGENFLIERRYSEGNVHRFPALAAELVGLPVDVIVTASTPAALAPKRATTTIPIVMATAGDPVESGLVASLARPGGNVTGLSSILPELGTKRLELLKELLPNVSGVAVLWSGEPPLTPGVREKEAAQTLGIALRSIIVQRPDQFARALSTLRNDRPDALWVYGSPVNFAKAKIIVDFAAANRLPAFYEERYFVDAGGLISDSPSFVVMFRRAATYVDKILKGAKPADLPVEQPTKFELAINLKTAKALGLKVPQSVLLRADEVIQ